MIILSLIFNIILIKLVKTSSNEHCELGSASGYEKELLNRLDVLKGIDFKATDDKYEYYFSICKTPSQSTIKDSNIGILQKAKDGSNQFVLGRFNDTDLEGGDNIIRIKYKNGDRRGVTCNGTERTSVVLIVCNYDLETDSLKFVEENFGRGFDCNYVFELQTNKICPNKHASKVEDDKSTTNNESKNSTGASVISIIFITIICLIVLYVVFGALYMRFIHNARGLEQIPNFMFWNKVGNKIANVCDVVCRCGSTRQEARPYESITGQASDDDDHMLNL